MTKPYSEDLRLRAVGAVGDGMSRRQAAKLFKVGASSVIRWSEQHDETGSVAAKRMGGSRGTKIAGEDREWLLQLVAEQPDLTLEEMRHELARQRGLVVGHGSIWRFFDREKQTFKKSLRAAQQDRPDVVEARATWHLLQRQLDPARLVFIDETWAKDNMTRLRGRCRRGERLIGKIPLARWQTTTFLAALRLHGMTAPMVLDGPIDGTWFLAYVEQVLCPVLEPGDIVIIDNLGSHRSDKVRLAIEAHDASLLYLPKYSPDLNPIENAFSKFKAALRKAGQRTTEALWSRIGEIVQTYSSAECANYFKAAGYDPS